MKTFSDTAITKTDLDAVDAKQDAAIKRVQSIAYTAITLSIIALSAVIYVILTH